MNETPEVLALARTLHEARMRFCWGAGYAASRHPWPDFADAKVRRAYPHNPISYVDIAVAQAKAVFGRPRQFPQGAIDAAARIHCPHKERPCPGEPCSGCRGVAEQVLACLAQGIETEGRDRASGLGAEPESPVAGGDAP